MAGQQFNTHRMVSAVFDTAATDSSGAANTTIAAHGLGVFIPSGAIVTRAFYRVNTTFTSATDAATIALKIEGAGDLKAAIAISAAGDVYDAGVRSCLPGHYALDGNALTAIAMAAADAASAINTTANREIVATVAVEALTAGKLTLFVEYVVE
jgi:hypothetical protein